MLGVAVVGVGRAGRARIQALEQRSDARLVASVRRGTTTFEAALSDSKVDAVLICTPNTLHAEMVRAALAAGKHVGVEFPLAQTADRARALFAQAISERRVLHVEHIELLSSSQQLQRERCAALGRPRGGGLEFSGGSQGWISDPELSGSAPLRALARLHRLVDLFGPARVYAAALQEGAAGYRLDLQLRFLRGGKTRLTEVRGPGRDRVTQWAIECEHGVLDDPPAGNATALFARDLECFLECIQKGSAPYVSPTRICDVLELVDQADELLR